MTRRDSLPAVSRRHLFVIGFILALVATGIGAGYMAADWLDDPVGQSGSIGYNATDGPRVTIDGQTNFSGSQVWPDNQTIKYVSEAGNLTATGADGTNLTVATSDLQAETVNYTNLDVSTGAVRIQHETHSDLTLEGETNWFEHRQVALDDGSTDFRYAGSTGSTNVTIRGLPANTAVGAVDIESGTLLDTATTSSSGVLSLSLPNSQHTVSLQTASGAPTFSNPSPTVNQSTTPDELSINVSDPDFPQDTVTVEFYLNGTLHNQTTVSNSGEVTATIDSLSAGTHEWYVEATDEYGQTTTSETYSFGTPTTLSIYNASAADSLVKGPNVSVTAKFFASDTVIRRTTTDGTIDLTGLPATEELLVSADADGYYSRRAIIKSLAEQQSMYLLPENASSVEVRFTLTDRTGEFPSQTSTLYLSKAIEQNNSTEWRVVAADQFGVSGYTVTLERDARYRLTVENEEGDRRMLGSHTASASETVPLTIGEIEFEEPSGEDYQWQASLNKGGENALDEIEFAFADNQSKTSDFHLTIHERGNASNVLYEDTADSLGEYEATPALSPNQSDHQWVVNWTASRGGEEISGRVAVGEVGELGLPVDSKWLSLMGYVFLVAAAALFPSRASRNGAIVVVCLATALTWFGIVPIPAPALGLSGAIALLGKTASFQDGGYA